MIGVIKMMKQGFLTGYLPLSATCMPFSRTLYFRNSDPAAHEKSLQWRRITIRQLITNAAGMHVICVG